MPNAPAFMPFLDDAAHLVELGGRRPPVRAANHRFAHRTLSDERPDVDGLLQRVELVEKRAERHADPPSGPSMIVVTPCLM